MCGKVDLAMAYPSVLASGHDEGPILVQDLHVQIFFRERIVYCAEQEIDVAIAQQTKFARHVIGRIDTYDNAWILTREVRQDFRKQSRGERLGTSNSYLPGFRVGQKLNILYPAI